VRAMLTRHGLLVSNGDSPWSATEAAAPSARATGT
jgi:hypothetical protein